MVREIIKSLREYRRASLITPLLVVGDVVLEVSVPFITAQLIDRIQAGATMEEILIRGAVLIGIALVSLCLAVSSGITCAIAASGLAKNLRHDLFSHIQTFSFSDIDKFSPSSLVTRLTTDVTNIQNAYVMIIRIAIRAPLILISAFVATCMTSWSIAAIFLAVIPVLAGGLFMIMRHVIPLFKKILSTYDKLNGGIAENISGIRVVKTYVRDAFECEKFDAASSKICRNFTHAERIFALNSPLALLSANVISLFVIYISSRVIVSSRGTELNVGQLSSLFTYGWMILMSLMILATVFVAIAIAIESAHRIAGVLSTTSHLISPAHAQTNVVDGSIDFEQVSFKYSKTAEHRALKNIELHIASGEMIGIIGGTGASKSTLVQLICRLYDASEGVVRVGGRDVREYDLTALRNAVAIVLQKNVVFSGTIRENLLWGNPQATTDEIIKACQYAQADEFISRFPNGYNTYIEQGGTNISGGQKQRLCIARALLKNPRILILDDSTSAVDTKTDAAIRQNLRSCFPQTTKIIIAQRTASVENADRIIVLDKGELVAVGTHQTLLETSAIYQKIHASQNNAFDDEQ